MGGRWPLRRRVGGAPAGRCRSEALRSRTSISRSLRTRLSVPASSSVPRLVREAAEALLGAAWVWAGTPAGAGATDATGAPVGGGAAARLPGWGAAAAAAGAAGAADGAAEAAGGAAGGAARDAA